jgi:hypothetical protein
MNKYLISLVDRRQGNFGERVCLLVNGEWVKNEFTIGKDDLIEAKTDDEAIEIASKQAEHLRSTIGLKVWHFLEYSVETHKMISNNGVETLSLIDFNFINREIYYGKN